MKYSSLLKGQLIKRYKRFLADIRLDSGEEITAHCVNTGSMKGCLSEQTIVYVSPANNPKRKLAYTLELMTHQNTLVGVNTHLTNKIALEALENNVISELPLASISNIQKEVKYGEKSRIDLLITHQNQKKTYLEIKNVSMAEGKIAYFPDAVSTRGLKHLNELIKVKKAGHNAAMLFVVQRKDVGLFIPAHEIDPEYGKTLIKAHKEGVQILVYQCTITPNENIITNTIDWKPNL